MEMSVGGGEQESKSGARILVVDDDERLCRSTAAGLARAGYQVFTAFDGHRAIEQAHATPPDVALVDLVMPTFTGIDVIRRLRGDHGESVHLIAATASDSDEMRQLAIEAGCDGFASKPTSIEDLRTRIEIALQRQRAFVDARLARETLERQRAFSSEAVALIAHDLRNAIMGCVSTLDVVGLSDLDPELIDLVRGSAASLKLVSTLVANLLDVSRFEDAAVMPSVQTVDVRGLLDAVVAVHAAAGSRIGWEVECDPALTARFDRGLVERILHNLVGNGRRYAGRDGLVRIVAKRWFEIPNGSVVISVENSGPPVEQDVVPKLFSKYGRGRDGKRGLGLYFARLACEAHGGELVYETVDARPVFVVRLPGTAS